MQQLCEKRFSRRICKDQLLSDGTPRRERGYRAFLDVSISPGQRAINEHKETLRYTVFRSPLLATEREAAAWWPDIEAIAQNWQVFQ